LPDILYFLIFCLYSSEPITSGDGTTNQNALQLPVESCDKVETPSESDPPTETVISG